MKNPVVFGKYLLLERLNVGGMAEVYAAKQFGVAGFERILAIKRILPSLAEDEEFIRMFIDEARISVLLNHANIVHIDELGISEQSYYIAMEYVAGKDLRAMVEWFRGRRQFMSPAQAVFIASRVCEGLDHAHRKKDARGRELHIIHRDVSPQNVLVSFEGDIKIIDFGIAKAANRLQRTESGILKGKFGYMSPEQVSGRSLDRRSDVFAVGSVLFELLTGEKLFSGDSDFIVLEKVKSAVVPPPSSLNPAISPELDRVVLKALAREPADRYQWASELQEDLECTLPEQERLYSSKQLSSFMREAFEEDLRREGARMEHFASIQRPDALALASEASVAALSAPARDNDGPDGAGDEDATYGSPPVALSGETTSEGLPLDEQTQQIDESARKGALYESSDPDSTASSSGGGPAGQVIIGDPSTGFTDPTVAGRRRLTPKVLVDESYSSDTVVLPAEADRTLFRLRDSRDLQKHAPDGRSIPPGQTEPLALTDPHSVALPAPHPPRARQSHPTTRLLPRGGQRGWRKYRVVALVGGGLLGGALVAGMLLYFSSERAPLVPDSEAVAEGAEPVPPSSDSLRPEEGPSGRADTLSPPPPSHDASNPPLGAPREQSKLTQMRGAESGARARSGPGGNNELELRARSPENPALATINRAAAERNAVRAGSATVERSERSRTFAPPERTAPLAETPRSSDSEKKALDSAAIGKLACSSVPSGAQIWLNGRYSGRDTPVAADSPLSLPPGRYEVLLVSADRSKKSSPQIIEVSEGETVVLKGVKLQ